MSFSWRGCFVSVVCLQIAEHNNHLSLSHLSLSLSLSLLSPLSVSLSLLSLSSLSSSPLAPPPSLSLSLSACSPLFLSLIHSCTFFFIDIRSYRDSVMSGCKGLSDCFAFFSSSLSYTVPNIIFVFRGGENQGPFSGSSSSKTDFIHSKLALHRLV